MTEDILPIGMDEMNRVFDVVDELEISRESIQVDLLPSGSGSVDRLPTGKIRIVLPESIEIEDWLPILASELRNASDQRSRAQS